jgi:hypothetical protein
LSISSIDGGASEFLVEGVVSELGFIGADYPVSFDLRRVSIEDLRKIYYYVF